MKNAIRFRQWLAALLALCLLGLQAPWEANRAAAALTYEAEDATLAGGTSVASDHSGYSGTGFVAGYTDANKGSASATFYVSVSSAGSYSSSLRYANGTGSAKTLSLYVNGAKLKQINLDATADWNAWTTEIETVSLQAGGNTIAYAFDSSDSGNVNLDRLIVDAASSPSGTNLALNRPVSASSSHAGYPASNATDGNASTYYEGAANGYPQTLTVDLGSAQTVSSVVAKLPAGWGARTQTIGVSGSADNASYATLAASGSRAFDPATGNAVAIAFAETSVRYVRLTFAANSGASAGQAGEFEVYGPGSSSDPSDPTDPSDPSDPPTPPTEPQPSYEAESAVLTGGAVAAADHVGYSGTGFAAGFTDGNKGSASAAFQVFVEDAGDYDVTLRYANGSTAAQTLSLYANGAKLRQVTLGATASWDAWTAKTDTVALNAGANTIAYAFDATDSGNVNLDRIELSAAEDPGTPPPPPTGDYGATMPYTTIQAEDAAYTGQLIGPSRTFGDLASEASGRKAVKLTAAGQYVQFALTEPAQGLTLRYSIPDNAAGTGIDSAISLYVGGALQPDIPLTSRYSWNYGSWSTEGGQIRWSNNPNAAPTTPHHMYDEVSVKLGQSYPAGTIVKLQRNASNASFSQTASVTIDLIETEAIPAELAKPADYLSIAGYGAVANDGGDDTAAINNAIQAVKNSGGTYRGVWIPAGTFNLNSGIRGAGYDGTGTRIYLDSGVSMKGAGVWHSRLAGDYAGIYLRGGNVTLSDFKISANDAIRDDYYGVTGVEGDATNSTLTNLWIEHAKVGVWLTNQTNGATVSNSRIRDVWADGLNLHRGTSNTTVSNNSVRNSGDDGLAMWSDVYLDANNTFSNNTVQLPTLANNIAIYGGQNNTVVGNRLEDTVVNGSGISFGTNFDPPSMTGTLNIHDNLLVRTGSLHKDYGYEIGGIWAYWLNNNGRAQSLTVNVADNVVQDATYSGIFIEEPAPSVSVSYDGNAITSPGTYGVYIRGSATGGSSFTDNTVTDAPSGKFMNASSGFAVIGSGNNW